MQRFILSTGGTLLMLLASSSVVLSQRNNNTIYNAGDYSSAGLKTLSAIQNLTAVLAKYPQSNMTNSSDAVMAELRLFYSQIDLVGASGFAYAF